MQPPFKALIKGVCATWYNFIYVYTIWLIYSLWECAAGWNLTWKPWTFIPLLEWTWWRCVIYAKKKKKKKNRAQCNQQLRKALLKRWRACRDALWGHVHSKLGSSFTRNQFDMYSFVSQSWCAFWQKNDMLLKWSIVKSTSESKPQRKAYHLKDTSLLCDFLNPPCT